MLESFSRVLKRHPSDASVRSASRDNNNKTLYSRLGPLDFPCWFMQDAFSNLFFALKSLEPGGGVLSECVPALLISYGSISAQIPLLSLGSYNRSVKT